MKVLVPLDGSARAEEALRTADRLLRHEDGGELYLHRVRVAAGPEDASPELQGVEQYLAGVIAHLGDKAYRIVPVASQAPDPSQAIATMAQSLGIDVIIMRSHGKSALKQFLLGSTAYNLSRLSKISVLIVKNDSDQE